MVPGHEGVLQNAQWAVRDQQEEKPFPAVKMPPMVHDRLRFFEPLQEFTMACIGSSNDRIPAIGSPPRVFSKGSNS
jgi:hypothetical protein